MSTSGILDTRTFRGDTSERWPWMLALLAAIGLAAYAGFRLPSLYTMTLYNVTVSDGAWRRGLFGTILTPLWTVTGYRYGVMALVALAFLGILLLVSLWAVVRVSHDAQRLLIVVWFASPAGGSLFHEIGYTDQVVYVLFFAAALALGKSRTVLAVGLVTVSVLIHEVTLFTTVPLMALVILIRFGFTRRLSLLAIPITVGGVLALAPTMSEEEVGATGVRLQELLPFEIRMEAVALFGRSLGQTWEMEFYSPKSGMILVLPALVVALVVTAIGLRRLLPERTDGLNFAIGGIALIAVALPIFLVFFGWDFHRWLFLGMANFLIVTVVTWQSVPRKISFARLGLGLAPLLLLFYLPMNYFDGYFPRPLTEDMFNRIVYSPHTEFLGFPDDRL